ncbi:hypothetical protein GUITHDRAFT_135672 [Guillardia theta CCMP2712]|uniref:Uncharacterized protein n=1 Tax=Guillardia theta (strain CCMP2712) TaxID=905079 RepID=L1JP71_GUITC|nr:hypothetical protein GUITHDRAFT_135672 [Guillardia theta CCMP2712]EKX49995.1 hypothetical protein GUITHDRAFT_135672 [Guillardia theta CCMP2712]|eukprot:XP_005836975.1 hypothetical protein GUITHDRAFT_135672 [Guillardia theta CCMP2712]
MDPTTLLITSGPPFAVADPPSKDDIYLPISRSPQLADNKRVFTSTRRFRVHNDADSARSLRSHDIPGAQASSTRNLLVTKRFGNDKKAVVGIYDEKTQHEVEAFCSVYHKASNTGLLGDAVLGSYLPHRSQSYRLKNKNVKYSLQTEDIFGAQPKQLSRFLEVTSRHLDPLSPKYKHPSFKPADPLVPKSNGHNSLDVKDLVFSAGDGELRPVFGVGKLVMSRADGGAAGLLDNKATRRSQRQTRNPLGDDILTITRGPTMPGITGSSFKSRRNTDPLAPAYHLSLELSAVDHETLRAKMSPNASSPGTNASPTSLDVSGEVQSPGGASPGHLNGELSESFVQDSNDFNIVPFQADGPRTRLCDFGLTFISLSREPFKVYINYGVVEGSSPSNLDLKRMKYSSQSGEGSPDLKGSTLLKTEDVDGAGFQPFNAMKSQVGGGIYGGSYRKSTTSRREFRETNQVSDIAGEVEGRPRYTTMHNRPTRHLDPLQPEYASLDGSGATLKAPPGSFNVKHRAAASQREKMERVDQRDFYDRKEAQRQLSEEISAVRSLE